MLKEAVKNNNIIEVSFNESAGLKTADGDSLRGLRLVNEFGAFILAQATIKNDKVYITVPENEIIKKVVYAWEGFPHANLVNGAGLPASTFMIDIK